jgi:hypothetical protein
MLEQRVLLLRLGVALSGESSERLLASSPPSLIGRIEEPGGGTVLGLVRRPVGPPRWRPWLSRPVLAVHENDDEPLLCTIHRLWRWRRTWEVRDADGHPVGQILTTAILSRQGWQGRIRWEAAGEMICQDYWKRTLATLSPSGDGFLLTFAEQLDGNPFAKMLLLGAVLSYLGDR